MKQPGQLYLIPSIIAPDSADVIPEQTKKIIKDLDYFLVENIRSARRFISSLKLEIQIDALQFELYDKRTTFDDIYTLLTPISKGIDGGIISEAGCPGIADPGALAVEGAHQLGISVIPLVGPSSIFLALMGSGLNGQSFSFTGYLPIDQNERTKRIKHLESIVIKSGQSQIFMETPYRNEALFNSMLETCNPNTRLCVAAGLTSPTEVIKTLTIANWKKQSIVLNKIPTIFILGV